MKTAAAALTAMLAIAALPSKAHAQTPVPDAPEPLPERRGPELTLGASVRGMLIPSSGFDPYSNNDVLTQFGLSAGITLFRTRTTAMIASAEWAFGGKSAQARGTPAGLFTHRLGGALETRFQPGSRLYLSLRLAPAAFALLASVDDPSLGRPLVARAWTWTAEATAGVGVVLCTDCRARVTFSGDVGYAFAGTATMSYAPIADENDQRKYGSMMLPPLKPAGGVSRLGMSVSF